MIILITKKILFMFFQRKGGIMQIKSLNPNYSTNTPNFKADKNDPLNQFYDKAKNKADMTDTVLVPRTIFKGYLGIMLGTVAITLSTLTKKVKFLSTPLAIVGSLISAFGTWSFVRPYIIKDAKGNGSQYDKNIKKNKIEQKKETQEKEINSKEELNINNADEIKNNKENIIDNEIKEK